MSCDSPSIKVCEQNRKGAFPKHPQSNTQLVRYLGLNDLEVKTVAQKNATPTKDQAQVIDRNGLKPALWSVVKELQYSMIIKHRITGEFKVIEK